jgi:Ca-activated chloride channel family protein
LKADNGLVRYRHALGAGRSAAGVIGELSVLVRIESGTPIKSVFSSTHSLAVQRISDHKVSASYEGAGEICDRNFDLYYSLARGDFGLTVLTHRLSDEDGFFLARIAPPAKVEGDEVIAKDITFVIDTSGSMSGEKIEQARKALTFCLDSLSRRDRFNLISFAHDAVAFRDAPVQASSENVAEARKVVGGLQASGGTNINEALRRSLEYGSSDDGRPHFIVFITDGLPTLGVKDPAEILKNVASRVTKGTRIFAFGVGFDVNSDFLDLLAEQNNGTREYVVPGEDLEIKLSSFYRKVADPVLADVELSFGELRVYDLYPPKLGDLFAGSELVVTGRYGGRGSQAIELRGSRGGKPFKFTGEASFPALNNDHDFLPRLWATRKIGFLLDQIRLHGDDKELKDTVVELATRYGIVTPYTAYLVTEPGSVAQHLRPQAERMAQALRESRDEDFEHVVREEAPRAMQASPRERIAADGQLRKARVRSSGAIQGQQQVQEGEVRVYQRSRTIRSADGQVLVQSPVRHVGRRAFYQVGTQWVESTFNEKKQTTRKIKLYSEEYYELLRQHPELAECFALGQEVVVVANNQAYLTME